MNQNEINILHITNKDFNSLLKSNQRYINHLAFNLHQDEEYLADLIQCGNIGLYNAYLTYNQSINPVFIAYAKFFIKKEMLYFIDTQLDIIRIPISAKYKNKVKIKTSHKTISTETKVYGDESDLTIGETLSQENDSEIPDERINALNKALGTLKDKDRLLIEEYFGYNDQDPKNFRELGEKYNMSKQAISDKIQRIKKMLKNKMI